MKRESQFSIINTNLMLGVRAHASNQNEILRYVMADMRTN